MTDPSGLQLDRDPHGTPSAQNLGGDPGKAAGISRRTLLRSVGSAAAFTAVGAGLSPLLAACGASSSSGASGSGASSSSSAGGAGANGTSTSLTVALYANPNSLDPATLTVVPEYSVTTSLYDTLLWRIPAADPQRYFPGLATSYEISPDASTYTFHLRQGVTFHDGTPFDANAVKFTFDRIVDPATKSINAKSQLGPYQETQVVDSHTVKVIFSKPNAAFLNNVTAPYLAIVSPTAVNKSGVAFSHNPVGTGPFKFVSWAIGQQVVVERNPNYTWGPDAGDLKGPAKAGKVIFRILTDTAAQVDALRTGQLTIAQNLGASDVSSLTSGGKFAKSVNVSSGVGLGFLMNVTKAPTDDLNVRKAIEYAVDQNALVKQVYGDLYHRADSLLTSVTTGYQQKQYFSYDPKEANALLDHAGWTRSGSGIRSKNGKELEVSFLLNQGFGYDLPAQVIVSQLQSVGIKATIRDEQAPGVFADIEKGVMNIASIISYFPDPYILATLFGCNEVGVGPNYAHYCNPSVDSAIAAANATADISARAAKYGDIVQTLMDDAVYIPVYNLALDAVYPKGLSGIQFTSLAVPVLTGTTL